MSSKKRFSIAPDLASGIRTSIQSASTNQGQLHYDMMAVDMIEPDPMNPRQLSIGLQDVVQGLDETDPDYATKQKEYAALVELAESIKRVGIRNAIEVYKEGSKYRIVSGERRYLAANLAGQISVPVRINPKPNQFNLRYMQWVENINRQDLSLWEKFNNLISIADAYQNSHQTDFTERTLQSLLGVSAIQAYRYFCLLKADEMTINLIQQGKLNNLKLVQELVVMKDKTARQQMITAMLQSNAEVTSLLGYKEQTNKKVVKTASKASIPLGSVRHPQSAKYLFDLVMADEQFRQYKSNFAKVDWSSAKSISKAFKTLCKVLEKMAETENATV